MLLLTALLACTSSEAPPDDVSLTDAQILEGLEMPGPHGVGYRVTSTVYTGPDGVERDLGHVALWYPTDATGGPAVRYRGLFDAPGVQGDVEPRPGSYPVVLYSHGHQGQAENNGQMMAHFASRGWLVVAPDHTGNTTFDGSDRQTPIYHQRGHDLTAALDLLLGPSSDDPLAAYAAGPVLGIGHSFGGYTIYGTGGAAFDVDGMAAACAEPTDDGICTDWTDNTAAIFRAGVRDERVSAVVSLAGGDFDRYGAAGLGQIEVPVLQQSGGLDAGNTGPAELIWPALPAPAWRVHVAHGAHQVFGDLAGSVIDTSDPTVLDGERSRRIGRIVLTAFAETQVLGDDTAQRVLDGEIAFDDDVTVSVHAP